MRQQTLAVLLNVVPLGAGYLYSRRPVRFAIAFALAPILGLAGIVLWFLFNLRVAVGNPTLCAVSDYFLIPDCVEFTEVGWAASFLILLGPLLLLDAFTTWDVWRLIRQYDFAFTYRSWWHSLALVPGGLLLAAIAIWAWRL